MPSLETGFLTGVMHVHVVRVVRDRLLRGYENLCRKSGEDENEFPVLDDILARV
jgi:hypothetical protein